MSRAALCLALLAGSWMAAPCLAEVSGGERAVARPAPGQIDDALRRGVDFLLESQNRDGSWGSARNTKGLNIYAPVPGAHHAFRAGVTGLCTAALAELAEERSEVRPALLRAEEWMERELPRLRRATPDAIYNVWGHAYSIRALVRLLCLEPSDATRDERLRRLIAQQVELLGRYELVDGGWGYYDFEIGTQKPAGSPTSFTTATVLIALHEARGMGIEAPQRLFDRAVASIRRQQKADFSYIYGEYLRWRPMHPVNRPGGSLGRTQVCNVALRLLGDGAITDEVIRAGLDRLFARNLWLDIGRKRPIPHESWFAVAGYFFYYGHYYAALSIEALPPESRPRYQDRLAAILLRLQEKDGSWWDYPLYDYHQPYGTAYALMSLKRCRRE
jgi:hypothetical protein